MKCKNFQGFENKQGPCRVGASVGENFDVKKEANTHEKCRAACEKANNCKAFEFSEEIYKDIKPRCEVHYADSIRAVNTHPYMKRFCCYIKKSNVPCDKEDDQNGDLYFS